MSRSVSEVLNAAADLIEPEGKWTQHYWAATKPLQDTRSDTLMRDPTAPDVECWCAMGSICRVIDEWDANTYHPAFRRLEAAVKTSDIAGWNDAPERTQSEVVAKLREAAKLAEAAS